MKRTLAAILTVAFLAALVPGLTSCKKIIPKKWYEDTLNYYSEGIRNGFKEKSPHLIVSAELEDKNNKIGYLLTDLDKDGVDELLIGIIDDAPATKFTNIVVCHSDLGPYSLLTGELYLCYDGVISMDNEYLRWNQKDNAFNVIDGEGQFLPMKWELTPFA